MTNTTETKPPHQVVIIGGGFGGLYAAKSLNNANVDVTLMRNHERIIAQTQ
ncbi:FAD-dependent pyridine nucleotide-disulfide oxidoreductase [Fischerella sp. NIES-4106]|nr:FAD-dependent pyridine nucleotide-disulfide oxidoreductase [Fischerella sp. NIES-4106]